MVFCMLRALSMQKAGDPHGSLERFVSISVEEKVGFEPTVRLRTSVFKTDAFDRSAISPRWSPLSALPRRLPTYKEGTLLTELNGRRSLGLSATLP